MVSTINEETRKNLHDFFEQYMKKFIFRENKITRERFFCDFEYFMSKYKDEEINLSIDKQIEILLFLKEALGNYRNYICIDTSTDTESERYISFYIEPCNIKEWEVMMNCIYDKKENACPF